MLRLFKQYYPIRNLFFIFGEGFFIYFSVLMASLFIIENDIGILNILFYLKVLFVAVTCLICLYYNDLYDLQIIDNFLELSIRLLQALGTSAIFLAVIYYIFPELIIGKGIFIISVVFIIITISSWRYCYYVILNKGLFNEKIIILGSSDLARGIINEIQTKKDSGYQIVTTIEEGFDKKKNSENNLLMSKEKEEQLYQKAIRMGVKKIIVALKERRGTFPALALLKCRVAGIDVMEGISFYEMLKGKLMVRNINPAWLIYSDGFKQSFIQIFFKRLEDILLSIILMILLSPLMLLTAIFIKIESEGPVIFSQERIGKGKKKYMVHKFRSMVADAEKKSGPVWAQKNDSRITRVGNFIRKTRIDEIPQLWNVIKGEMSFVGPRPEREFFVNQLEEIIPYYRERFVVKPGLTGWAQVSYGYGETVEDAIQKLNYELFYIKNMSIFLDIVVIFRTIKTVISKAGQ